MGTVTTGLAVRKHATLNDLAVSWLEWPDPGLAGRCSILLLHGILQSADPNSHIANHLARFHRVVMPDLRGRGETGLRDADNSPAAIAGDVAALIETLGLEHVIAIGRNHGGVVGYHLAAQRPELVALAIVSRNLAHLLLCELTELQIERLLLAVADDAHCH